MDCHLAASLKSLRRSILVIGYGNPLRSDDGIGPQVAREVAGWGMPDVEAIAVHQLTPELAESLASVNLVIFIDAYPATPEQDLQVCALEPAESGTPSGHWCTPQVLLAITQALYDHCPQGWWVIVPGVNFDLGEGLSPVATQGVATALQEIKYLMHSARTEPCTKLG